MNIWCDKRWTAEGYTQAHGAAPPETGMGATCHPERSEESRPPLRQGEGGYPSQLVSRVEATRKGPSLPSGRHRDLGLVPGERFELSLPCGMRVLSPLRLPFRHPGVFPHYPTLHPEASTGLHLLTGWACAPLSAARQPAIRPWPQQGRQESTNLDARIVAHSPTLSATLLAAT